MTIYPETLTDRNRPMALTYEEEEVGWPKPLVFSMVTLGMTMGAFVLIFFGFWLNSILDEEEQLWGAISYEQPSQVINPNGTIPGEQIDNVPVPTILVGSEGVPVRLTRYIDCAAFECPDNSIPVTIDVVWTQLNTNGGIVTSVVVSEDIPVDYIEGEDYVKNTLNTETNQLPPFKIPEGVLDIHNNTEGGTAWRIVGTTTPELVDAFPSSFTTEVFHLFSEEYLEER